MKTVLESIDTRYGTDSQYEFSHGNTLPYTGVPFGMNYFVPQSTHQKGAWFFDPNSPVFQGIRLTHQPSPWIGDFSQLLLTPVTEHPKEADLFFRQSSYRLQEAIFQPHYLKIHSERYQITTEVTPSRYGAIFCFTNHSHKVLSLLLHSPTKTQWKQIDDYTVTGTLFQKTENDHPLTMYLYLQSDTPIHQLHKLGDDTCLDFTKAKAQISLSTSFISQDQAKAQAPSLDFDKINSLAQKKWSSYLDRIEILEQGEADRSMFDHALYRLFLFPQTFYEVDENGDAHHLDITNGDIKQGKLFTNIGFWDSFRTLFPLFSIIAPECYHDFLEGFLNSYKETGFLPKWLSPDERGMMPGTLIDGVIADAVVKNIAPDLEVGLFAAMLDTAKKIDPTGRYGRHGADLYQALGYLPSSFQESVSHTLDDTYSDFCIATVAKHLKKEKIAQEFYQSSKNYLHLFDTDTGYMRAKSEEGHFIEPFSPYSWGKDYAECSALQTTVGVLHDIEGLKTLMGGEKNFTKYLIRLSNDMPRFEVTGYGYEIHEMSETAAVNFGQIAISNQPSFHIPYLFQYSSHPEYTSYIINSIRHQTFQAGFQAYPGDEDNGSLSAWYILSSLGFYPTCPGKAEYDLGIPLFNHVKLYLAQTKQWLHIYTKNNHPHFQFVKQVSLDQQLIRKLKHHELLAAKDLTFTLSWLPEGE